VVCEPTSEGEQGSRGAGEQGREEQTEVFSYCDLLAV